METSIEMSIAPRPTAMSAASSRNGAGIFGVAAIARSIRGLACTRVSTGISRPATRIIASFKGVGAPSGPTLAASRCSGGAPT